MTYEKSNELLARGKMVTPLGAQTFSKSYRYYCEGDAPAFIARGKGSHVWDVDGNEFIDFVCGLGPITIGYNDERVNEAIIKQMEKGIIFSQPAQVSIELAEKLSQLIPAAEMIRFVKNGSDATTAAVRLARAFTGKDIIATCGYHGMHDWSIGASPNNKGVPKVVCDLSKKFNYNDLDSLQNLFDQYPNQIAAVILEPIQGNGPFDGYLKQLKALVHKNQALLIFDEVVSGFRYAMGGASELYNITPDLASYGKGIANGMPLSAVVGKREIIDQISKGVFISTTFGGDALSMAAALETIRILEREKAFDKFWHLGNLSIKGMTTLIEKYELQSIVSVSGLAPHCGLQFEGTKSLDYLDIYSVFQQKMIENGILSVGINNLCLAHNEKDMTSFVGAVEDAFADVSKVIEKGSIEGMLRGKKVDPIFKRH